MSAILTTLMGGLLAIAGGLVGVALSSRGERYRWLRDSQLRASANLLSGLQLVVRRMINVAYVDPAESRDQASPVVAAFNEAMVVWNNARYAAMLVTPPKVAEHVDKLDCEVDRLVDLACAQSWTRQEFRQERKKLGRMAAEYLRVARQRAGLADIELPSIWTWDRDDADS